MPNIHINATPMAIACFRFGLIAPVIQGTYSESSEAAYYRRITTEPIELPDGNTYKFSPDTLERWASHYRKKGMDGLLPSSRKDKGSSRKIDSDAGEEIRRLLAEHPGTNGVSVHSELVKTVSSLPP